MKKVILTLIFMLSFQNWNAQKILQLNEMAPEIQAKNILGEDFTLSSQKGKIVLLDFWATWCAPCVEEQPLLKKFYIKNEQAVKDGRFEIVGFSLDKSKENWKKIIDREGITWPQISDLQFWKSPVAKIYGINELPYNLVLDSSGKIIAINLHGEELETFIEKQLKKEF